MSKNVVVAAFLAMLVLAYFTLVDRYPTVRDCLAGVDHYVDRGLFPGTVAIEYRTRCRDAEDREARDAVVWDMDDEASIRASRRGLRNQ